MAASEIKAFIGYQYLLRERISLWMEISYRKVTVKEEMFGTHEKRAKLLELLEKHDGNELLAMIDNGSIQNEFAVNKNIALNKQENKPELNKPEGNHEPPKHEEIKEPGK